MEDIVSSILIGLILLMTEKENNIEQAKLWGLFFILFGVLAVVVQRRWQKMRRKKKLPNIAQENPLPTSSWKAIQ